MTVLMRLLCVTAVLVAAVTATWSYPTLFGDSGMILVPTASTINDAYIQFGMDYSRVSDDTIGNATIYPLRLLYGASASNELFAVAAASSGTAGTDVLGGGFKINLLKEDWDYNTPGFAIGLRILDESGAIDRRVIEGYGVASKTLLKRGDLYDLKGFILSGHLAGFYTRIADDNPTFGSENFWSIAGGVSYYNMDGTNLAIDYVPTLKSNGLTFRDSELSAVVRRPLSKEFFVEAGVTEPFGLGHGSEVFAGLLYSYGIRQIPTESRPNVGNISY